MSLFTYVVEQPPPVIQYDRDDAVEYLEHIPHGYFIREFAYLIFELDVRCFHGIAELPFQATEHSQTQCHNH